MSRKKKVSKNIFPKSVDQKSKKGKMFSCHLQLLKGVFFNMVLIKMEEQHKKQNQMSNTCFKKEVEQALKEGRTCFSLTSGQDEC